MDVKQDLVGKTITGVIATQVKGSGIHEIWMLQFADGTHVEFVSPAARKALRRATKGTTMGAAQKTAKPASTVRSRRLEKAHGSQKVRFERNPEGYAQLSLNVA